MWKPSTQATAARVPGAAAQCGGSRTVSVWCEPVKVWCVACEPPCRREETAAGLISFLWLLSLAASFRTQQRKRKKPRYLNRLRKTGRRVPCRWHDGKDGVSDVLRSTGQPGAHREALLKNRNSQRAQNVFEKTQKVCCGHVAGSHGHFSQHSRDSTPEKKAVTRQVVLPDARGGPSICNRGHE